MILHKKDSTIYIDTNYILEMYVNGFHDKYPHIETAVMAFINSLDTTEQDTVTAKDTIQIINDVRQKLFDRAELLIGATLASS